MDLTKIISVTGKSGLYRVVAQGRQAVIAESLDGWQAYAGALERAGELLGRDQHVHHGR